MSEEVKEVSKAIQEASKFGAELTKTTDKIFTFIAKIFKEPIKEAAGIIGDKLKFLRWQRQLRMVEQAEKILREKNIKETKAVPIKFALPIIENASIEENDELQDLWIRLLTNSMDPDFKLDMRYAFIDIIKNLNPLDIKILDHFYNALLQDPKVNWGQITNYSLTKEQLCQSLKISLQDYYISIYNLFRVQCLAPAILVGGAMMNDEPITIFKGANSVTMTPLGVIFVKSCIKND